MALGYDGPAFRYLIVWVTQWLRCRLPTSPQASWVCCRSFLCCVLLQSWRSTPCPTSMAGPGKSHFNIRLIRDVLNLLCINERTFSRISLNWWRLWCVTVNFLVCWLNYFTRFTLGLQAVLCNVNVYTGFCGNRLHVIGIMSLLFRLHLKKHMIRL